VPRRGATAHKGTGGHLVVVAGSAGKTGAALLTARAALRAGAGLVTIASTAAGQAALDAKVVEPMTVAYAQGDDAANVDESFGIIAGLCAHAHARAVALGPGIPLGAGMRAVVERLVREIQLPMVVDADGLNQLGGQAATTLAAAPAARVITPHPGEMARLCGRTTSEVQADRLAVARDFAAGSRAIVVLKGARTLIVAPDGRAFVNPTVEPGLATAGSGDVLTGIVGSLLTQGMEPLAAALAAVFLHGRAGTEAARLHGPSGVVAGDLPELVADVKAAWR
jgi:NAD(P)H-hydrate epimerase